MLMINHNKDFNYKQISEKNANRPKNENKLSYSNARTDSLKNENTDKLDNLLSINNHGLQLNVANVIKSADKYKEKDLGSMIVSKKR